MFPTKILKSLPAILLFFNSFVLPQSFSVSKIEPPNWWTNLKPDTVELMIYGKNLSGVKVKSVRNDFKIVRTVNADSKNYLFVYFVGRNLKAGEYPLVFQKGKATITLNYQVSERHETQGTHAGFDENDVVYLIFVDRFCDGDTTNESIPNSSEEFQPMSLNGRHGGDLQGIIDKLDYLKKLGVTVLWITPVLENNMWMSYHGYAATDLYKIDPRFGDKEIYRQLVNEAHKRGLKIIMDHVSNHIGINHVWVKDPPKKDWFHGTVKKHPKAFHNKIARFDLHGDSVSPRRIVNGWFTDYMPDLNKSEKLLADYMIENTIWWVQYLGIDGIREDTYPYNDLEYMSRWAKTIFENYPRFNIVAEVWKGSPVFLSEYQANPVINRGFNSHIPSITDFAVNESLVKFLKGKSSLNAFYETLAKDYVYSDPSKMLIFLDNHDIDRAMFDAGGDLKKFKIALGILLTTRGIPQLLYGTEIGMDGGKEHGKIRAHFPGGFPKDSFNAFVRTGRTQRQNEIYDYTQTLLRLRKKLPALRKGKLIQFPPENEIYIYFRILDNQKIMVVVNESKKERLVHLQNQSYLLGTPVLKNLLSGEKLDLAKSQTIKVKAMSIQFYLVSEK